MGDTRWELRACAEEPDLWTPCDGNAHDKRKEWGYPRAICLECPVLKDCQTWIIGLDEDPCPLSMVAALTPGQRKELRRKGLRSKCGTRSGRKEHALLGEEPCVACKEARNAGDRARRTKVPA